MASQPSFETTAEYSLDFASFNCLVDCSDPPSILRANELDS
jgi:hypothetical protein